MKVREYQFYQTILVYYWYIQIISLMQSERNSKLRVLIRGYNWNIKIKIALETKIDTYFETEGVIYILLVKFPF